MEDTWDLEAVLRDLPAQGTCNGQSAERRPSVLSAHRAATTSPRSLAVVDAIVRETVDGLTETAADNHCELMARYAIDAVTLVHLVTNDVSVAPAHQLVAPNAIRSDALLVLYASVRRA